MRKVLLFLILLLLSCQFALAQSYEYWLDNDYDGRATVAGSMNTPLTVDLDGLPTGIHYFNFRAKNEAGEWGGLYRYLIYVSEQTDVATEIASYEYWLDNDYTERTTVAGSMNTPQTVDLDGLPTGVHYFNFRVKNEAGEWGGLYRYLIYVSAQTDVATEIASYEYWLDNDYDSRATVVGSMNAPLTVDLDGLPTGIHYFNFRAKNETGEWGGLYRYLFYISHSDQTKESVAQLEYWIDEDTDTVVRAVNGADFSVSIDVSQLAVGQHMLNCRLHTVGGKTSDDYSYPFTLEQIYDIDVTFDGLVLTVNGNATMTEALNEVGGRNNVVATIATIVWNSSEALTQDDLQGIDNPNLLVYAADRAQVPYTVNNVVVGGVARDLILTDDGTGNCNFYCPLSFTAQHATYSRDFSQRTQPGVSQGWETLALPFDVQEMRHATRGAILPFGATGNGRHFWLRRQTAEGGLAQATGIEANRAYLISMPNSDSYDDSYNLAGRVTFSATDVTIPVTAVADSTGSGIRLTAAFQRIEQSPVVYAINRGEAYGGYAEGSVFVSGLREVRPFEAYTVHQDTTVPAPLYIPIDGEAWLTNITPVSADMQPGTGQYYDLQGRRVAQPTNKSHTSGLGLKKGLYIVNGQKAVVR